MGLSYSLFNEQTGLPLDFPKEEEEFEDKDEEEEEEIFFLRERIQTMAEEIDILEANVYRYRREINKLKAGIEFKSEQKERG